jgi:hypothetical protein
MWVGIFLALFLLALYICFPATLTTVGMWTEAVDFDTHVCLDQDCAVGLLFALLPVLGDTGGVMSGLVAMSRS